MQVLFLVLAVFVCVCLFRFVFVLFCFVLFFEGGVEGDNFVMHDFLVQEQYVTPDLHLDF